MDIERTQNKIEKSFRNFVKTMCVILSAVVLTIIVFFYNNPTY